MKCLARKMFTRRKGELLQWALHTDEEEQKVGPTKPTALQRSSKGQRCMESVEQTTRTNHLLSVPMVRIFWSTSMHFPRNKRRYKYTKSIRWNGNVQIHKNIVKMMHLINSTPHVPWAAISSIPNDVVTGGRLQERREIEGH